MDAAFQFACTDILTWSFITQFLPNFIYGLLSSNYSSCQYGFCLMNDTKIPKQISPFHCRALCRALCRSPTVLVSELLFQKKNSGILSKCQNSTNILSVLIWVQTVYKGYQQTTKVAASKEGVIIHIVY